MRTMCRHDHREFRREQASLFFFSFIFILRFVMASFARRENGRKIRGGENNTRIRSNIAMPEQTIVQGTCIVQSHALQRNVTLTHVRYPPRY